MPNWCENTLIISGNEELMQKFYNENRDEERTDLSFEKAVPIDDDENWYELHIENWGTKWDACEVLYDDDGIYDFETAWSPPIDWFRVVVQKYPELHFELRYSEQGMNFSGYMMAHFGEIYDEHNGDYGEYNGKIYCGYCETGFKLRDINTDYCEYICYDCLKEKKDIITNAVRNVKIKRLPFKNACNRISRNPIFDQFLMRKVFVKRVELTLDAL